MIEPIKNFRLHINTFLSRNQAVEAITNEYIKSRALSLLTYQPGWYPILLITNIILL